MLWVFSKKFQEQFSFQAIMTSKSNKRIKQYSLNMIQRFLNFSIKDLFSKYEQLRKKFFFFTIWVSFHEHSQFTGQQGKGKAIPIILLYHYHSLHRHLGISRVITVESSPLHITCGRTRTGNLWFSERKWLTTNLRPREQGALIEPLAWWIIVRDQRNP